MSLNKNFFSVAEDGLTSDLKAAVVHSFRYLIAAICRNEYDHRRKHI